MALRCTGKVKFFNDTKGFGFLILDSDGSEAFVHRNEIPKGLRMLDQEQRVTFEVTTSEKGQRAVRVELA